MRGQPEHVAGSGNGCLRRRGHPAGRDFGRGWPRPEKPPLSSNVSRIRTNLPGHSAMSHDDVATTPALARALEQVRHAEGAARVEAVNDVFRLCETRLRALVHRMLGGFPNVRRWEETDDVFQNAAIRLHRTLRQIPVDSPRDLFALAARQLHWELIDLARLHGAAQGKHHATNAFPSDGTMGSGPLDRAAAPEPTGMEQWAAFHKAVEALPEEHKEIFHLVWYMGADQKTVCELTGKPLRTVKRHWAKARDAVKASLCGESPPSTQS